jgi:hypothetical protein
MDSTPLYQDMLDKLRKLENQLNELQSQKGLIEEKDGKFRIIVEQ